MQERRSMCLYSIPPQWADALPVVLPSMLLQIASGLEGRRLCQKRKGLEEDREHPRRDLNHSLLQARARLRPRQLHLLKLQQAGGEGERRRERERGRKEGIYLYIYICIFCVHHPPTVTDRAAWVSSCFFSGFRQSPWKNGISF